MTPDEASEYADQVLAPYPAEAPRRATRAFAELMEWFDGHPLSMRLVLPHLETTDPEVLLSGLRGITPLPGGDGGCTTSLAASVTYSFDRLTADARRLLVVVSLFQGVADVDVLGLFSQVAGVPQHFRGCTTVGWATVLDQAARVGLLTPLGGVMYRIHPALPTYLAQQWRREEPDDYYQQRTTANAARCWTLTPRSENSLTSRARPGTPHSHSRSSTGNGTPSAPCWKRAGPWPMGPRPGHRRAAQPVLGCPRAARRSPRLGGPGPPHLGNRRRYPARTRRSRRNAMALFTGLQANRELEAHHLDAAERTYLNIHDMLQAQSKSSQQLQYLAGTYHQLGWVAQARGRLDDGEHWYGQSLTINQQLGNRPDIAASFGQLGLLAETRGRVEEALEWLVRCVTLFDEFFHPMTGTGPTGSFTLMEFAEFRPVTYLDSETSCLFLEQREQIAAYWRILGVLAETALGEGQSKDLIATLATELYADREDHVDRAPEPDSIVWNKSSYSAVNGGCVEVGWRTSSHSGNGEACVKVASAPDGVLVRDSKDRDGPALDVPVTTWRGFLRTVTR